MFVSRRKPAAFISIAVLILTACARAETPTPTEPPTALPFGTVQVEPSSAIPTETPTATPRPRVCVFPADVDGTGRFEEAAAYRFDWVQGEESQTIQTRGGPVEITGPVTLPAGERELIIVHRAPVSERIALADDASPSTAFLYDPASPSFEARSPAGVLLQQTILDPPEDVRGLPPNLDILSVVRKFGEGDSYIIRVTLAEPDDGKYIWTFEGVEILLGEIRYAERTLADGATLSGFYDPQGQFSEWDGTMVKQGNTVTWALEEGGELPFGARSFTSAAAGDETPLFPVDLMERLWRAARAGCG